MLHFIEDNHILCLFPEMFSLFQCWLSWWIPCIHWEINTTSNPTAPVPTNRISSPSYQPPTGSHRYCQKPLIVVTLHAAAKIHILILLFYLAYQNLISLFFKSGQWVCHGLDVEQCGDVLSKHLFIKTTQYTVEPWVEPSVVGHPSTLTFLF